MSLSSLISILATPAIGAGMMTALTAIVGLLTGPVGIGVAAVAVMTAVVMNWDKIIAATQRLYEGIKTWLVDKFTGLVAAVQGKIQEVVGAFQGLYNTVVGQSIVPDLIAGVGQQFGKLDQVMVQPVQAASAETIRALAEVNAYTAQVNALLSRNSLFTSGSTLERVGMIKPPGAGGGAGGGAVTINNTINIVDTQDNLARRISERNYADHSRGDAARHGITQ